MDTERGAGRLADLLRSHEDWLMDRVLSYASRQGYVRYTSTLREAWRLSVAGLSASIAAAVESAEGPLELGPDETFEASPVAAFGVREARVHRERGVSLPMFLGLFKYYRQAYLDLVVARGASLDDAAAARMHVERCFDRIEIALAAEWASRADAELLEGLGAANRRAINEKNAYLTVFESLRDPAILLDAEGRVAALNHAAALLLDPEAVPGSHYYRAEGLVPELGSPVSPDGAAAADRALGAPLVASFPWLAAKPGPGPARPGAADALEVTVEIDGAPRWFDVVSSRMLDVSGKFAGTVLSLRDVTALRRTEEERRRYEHRVLEAQRLESLALLAGGVAHDFNNLLTGIVAATSLAQKDAPPGSELASLLDIVLDSASRAADLARQMLAYSGRGHFVLAPVDLSEVVASMEPLLRSAVTAERGLELDLAGGLPRALADELQVRQVVLALASNAAEAYGAERGTVVIATSALRVDPGQGPCTQAGEVTPAGHYVCLEVRDRGAGMDAAARARVFDPFYSTKSLGRGLGLSAVQGIVRGHCASIEIDSAPGWGTSVRVLLPVAAEAPPGPAEAGPSGAPGLGATILVVDDEAAVRSVARRVLERSGYRVLLARDGVEALEVVGAHGPGGIDAVLLDWTMPRKGGLETLGALRAERRDLPVVVTSGYRAEEVIAELGGAEVADVLPKPFGSEDLLAAVRACIARRR